MISNKKRNVIIMSLIHRLNLIKLNTCLKEKKLYIDFRKKQQKHYYVFQSDKMAVGSEK